MGGRKEEWMPKYYTISQIRFELWKRKAKEIKQDIILELFFDEDFFFFFQGAQLGTKQGGQAAS